MDKTYKLNDQVIMKKPHACGTNLWQIVRTGVDIKIKCINCGREVMLERLEFNKKLKKVLGDNDAKTFFVLETNGDNVSLIMDKRLMAADLISQA